MWLDVISQNSCFTVVSNAFNRPSFVEFEFMNQSINTYNILETLPPLNGGERCSNTTQQKQYQRFIFVDNTFPNQFC